MPSSELVQSARGASSFNSFTTETSNVRDVSTRMILLEQDRTPLYVLTNNSKRKVTVTSPRIEWLEDQDLPMLGTVSNGTTDYSSTNTGVFVTDVTLFGVNDVCAVTGSTQSTSTLEELILVTAVSGSTNGTLTITRGFASTTAGTISATAPLRILFTAQTEGGAIASPRASSKSARTSGAQIFEWPIQITRTGASTKVYGDRPERSRLQFMGMRRQKLEIENAGLFGSFSETLSGTSSRYTSMGVRSIVASYITNLAGPGTLTYTGFLDFSRLAFRYGSPQKLLLASPLVKEALDYFAGNKQFVYAEDAVFGVSLKRFVTSNGTWMLANNYNMDAMYADEAIGVDLPSVEYCPLNENGINNDTKMFLDFDTTNPKVIRDLVYTQAGWRIWHEARHARLTGVLTFA